MKTNNLLLSLLAMVCLIGCGNKTNPIEQDNTESVQQKEETAVPLDESRTDSPDASGPGFETGAEKLVLNDKGESMYCCILAPKYIDRLAGTGYISTASDGVRLILDGQVTGREDSVIEEVRQGLVDAVDKVFPAYFQQTEKIYEYELGRYELVRFIITDTELMTINGSDMCRYEGEHEFQFQKVNYKSKFIAYAVRLSNGAFAYWMVLDETEDQSMYDTVVRYADGIAYTFHEEE